MTESFFNTIFKKDFHKYVYFASKYVAKQDAEDIVSHVFYKLWERSDRFEDDEDAIAGFIYIAVKNKCLDRLRTRNFFVFKVVEESEDCILAKIIQTEFLQEMLIYIEQLPETRKTIIKAILEGKSNKTICEELKKSEVAIREAKWSAIQFLKSKMTYFL